MYAGPYTGGVRTNPPFRLGTYVIYSHLARLDRWLRLRCTRGKLSVIDHANATLQPRPSNLLARVNLLIDMRTSQHAVLAAFSHQPWMHICIFYPEIVTVFAIVKCSERLQGLY